MAKVAIVLAFGLLAYTCAHGALAGSKIGASLKTKTRTNILVSMKHSTSEALKQITTRLSTTSASRAERATSVYNTLKNLADYSQASVLQLLNSRQGAAVAVSAGQVRSLWVTNQIYVQGADWDLIESLAELEEVSRIEEEIVIKLDSSIREIRGSSMSRSDNSVLAEWGIEKIQTLQAWAAAGTDGAGVVVGVIDTGARSTHQDLRGSYRGGNHSWFNPYAPEPQPTDENGHGTFVTGLAVGAGGIGVAPGAQWISCKGFDDFGFSTNAGLIACGQFFLCPHDYLGNNPDCNLAPDVSSNSWGAGGGDATWYDGVIEAYHAAGIIPVFANGNSGPSCGTGATPANSVADVIAVGATTSGDAIASFSSRGPGTGTPVMTPHVSAPGQDVISASSTGDDVYAVGNGTSFATPHVAGLAALLKAVQRDVPYLTLRTILQTNADRNLVFVNQECGGVSDSLFPNYQFGYGRINALRAVNALLAMQP